MKKYLYFMSTLGILLFSCKKDEKSTPTSPYDSNKLGYITIKFDSQVGDLNLVPDSPFYSNSYNQKYTISKLNYFVSNIVFIKEDSTTYTIPQDSSYFLIQESNYDSKILRLRVPEGNYVAVRFMIGVDSLRSTMPLTARTGALDPSGAAAAMYWTWASGYIFMKMEGTYDDQTDSIVDFQPYQFHIGGFNSPINNIKIAEVDFREYIAAVRQSKGTLWPEVHIYADASKVISGPENVDLTKNSFVMFAPYSLNISKNYVNMFTLAHVHDE